MEPRNNEGPRDWQSVFALTRFRYIEILFHRSFDDWGKKKNRSLYPGTFYVEVCYVEVPPYNVTVTDQFEPFGDSIRERGENAVLWT